MLLLHRIFILEPDQDQRCNSFNQASLQGNSNFAAKRAMTFKTISLVRVDDGDADPASHVEGMPWQIDIANAQVEPLEIRY